MKRAVERIPTVIMKAATLTRAKPLPAEYRSYRRREIDAIAEIKVSKETEPRMSDSRSQSAPVAIRAAAIVYKVWTQITVEAKSIAERITGIQTLRIQRRKGDIAIMKAGHTSPERRKWAPASRKDTVIINILKGNNSLFLMNI